MKNNGEMQKKLIFFDDQKSIRKLRNLLPEMEI